MLPHGGRARDVPCLVEAASLEARPQERGATLKDWQAVLALPFISHKFTVFQNRVNTGP